MRLNSQKTHDDNEHKRSRTDDTLGKRRKYHPRVGRFLDLTVRGKYVDAIDLGAKTIEGPNLDKYSWVQSGDAIRFFRSRQSRRRCEPCIKLVESVWEYDSWM